MDREINVLFTSAGRRGYLLDWFRESGHFQSVVAVNSEPCTAFSHADSWEILPEVVDHMFEVRFLEIIEKHRIHLVIPLTDLDAFVISRLAPHLSRKGTFFLGPNWVNVARMVDKGSWPDYLAGFGFPVPKTFRTLTAAKEAIDSGKITFPLVVKPRVGTSSKWIEVVKNVHDLSLKYESLSLADNGSALEKLLDIPRNERFIVQEFFSGIEYGFDLLADFSQNFQGSLARQKVTMRAGETDMAITLPKVPVDFSMKELSETLGVIGLVDVDLIKGVNGDAVILDINPRIGGGYPFSHLAGADLPGYVSRWMDGRKANIQSKFLSGKQVGKEISLTEVPIKSPQVSGS